MIGVGAGLLLKRYGLYLALALALIGLAVAIYLGGRSAGRAAVEVDRLRETLRRTEEAQRARAGVRPGDVEAMNDDQFNRDRAQ